MPNGGSDCCGNCLRNKANKNSSDSGGMNHCKLREVVISNPFWTYCDNFIYHSRSKEQYLHKEIIKGPIYSSGIYEGYVRIPWNGKHEPETYVSGICSITGRPFSEGIRVFDESSNDYLYFESNTVYCNWFRERNKKEYPTFDVNINDKINISNYDLHKIYTEIYKKGYLELDFIHLGKDILLHQTEIHDNELINKSRGVLIGGAIGDALGRAVEGQNPGNYWIEHYEKWKGWESGAIGTITDDSQMTIWLSESLIENKGLNPEHVAKKFASHRIRGIGRATKEFVTNFKDQHLSWYEAGVKSSGNGVAMRSSPIGIFYLKNSEELNHYGLKSIGLTMNKFFIPI